jgi:hypothetical protein
MRKDWPVKPPQTGLGWMRDWFTAALNWRWVQRLRFSVFQYGEYPFTVQWKVLNAFGAAVSIGIFPVLNRRTMTDNSQSRGEPDRRGTMPRNRASVITKSSYCSRMYRKAASIDSAATQRTSESLSSGRIVGPVKLHNWASHAPVVPGRNRVLLADLFVFFFVRRRLSSGPVTVPRKRPQKWPSPTEFYEASLLVEVLAASS